MALKIELGQKATPIEDGKYFTKGRKYQIVAVSDGNVTLIDDEGDEHPCGDSAFIRAFKAVEQEAPNSFFTLPEPQTEGTHIHAALLAQDATGLFVTGLNAEEMEELRVPGKRKPMDSVGDLIRNYPDLATDLAADDEFTAAFLNALADRVHATNVKAGWWTDLESGQSSLHTRNVGEMLMLVVSEISEALEAVRKNLMDDKLPHRPGLIVELADAVIRILDLAGSRMAIERASGKIETCDGYDHHPFGTVLIEKMAYNRTRSDHQIANRLMHGGKKI